MKCLITIFFTVALMGTIISSDDLNGKKFILYNQEFYLMKKNEALKNQKDNIYVFQKILKNIYFDFSFISSAKSVEDSIALSIVDITKLNKYKPETHDKLLTNMIQIQKDGSLLICFKKKFSEIEFLLLRDCLSYAYKKNKKLVIDQNLLSYLYRGWLEDLNSVSSENLENTLLEKTILNDFSHIASPQEADIIIPIYVILKPTEKETLLDAWFLISSQDSDRATMTMPFMKEGNIIENINTIVEAFNAKYKDFIKQMKIELKRLKKNKILDENQPSGISPFVMRYGLPAASYTMRYRPTVLRYGKLLAATLPYLVESYYGYRDYQKVGSLKKYFTKGMFFNLPQNRFAQSIRVSTKAKIGSDIFNFLRSTYNWIKKHILKEKQ